MSKADQNDWCIGIPLTSPKAIESFLVGTFGYNIARVMYRNSISGTRFVVMLNDTYMIGSRFAQSKLIKEALSTQGLVCVLLQDKISVYRRE
jgi:hypothetical protein